MSCPINPSWRRPLASLRPLRGYSATRWLTSVSSPSRIVSTTAVEAAAATAGTGGGPGTIPTVRAQSPSNPVRERPVSSISQAESPLITAGAQSAPPWGSKGGTATPAGGPGGGGRRPAGDEGP